VIEVRMTAVYVFGAETVHLGIDTGPTRTAPRCGARGAMVTTAIRAANHRECVALALASGLAIEGLVEIPERLRRIVQALHVHHEGLTAGRGTVELAFLLEGCTTVASAVERLRKGES
jgi:hypothetical protein